MTSPVWRKSSRSTEGTTGDCVEVADLSGFIGVRDSKTPDTEHLTLPAEIFADLVARVKRDELSV